MTYFKLARRNTWRKPLRTLMLMLCVAVAFLIYGLTASFENGTQSAAAASEDLLAVMSRAGTALPLPLAQRNRISQIEGVAAVGYSTRLRGFVEVEKNIVPVNAADPAGLMQTSGAELGITPAMLADLTAARDRVLVGRALAEAQGWQVGQRVEVTAFRAPRADGSPNWGFDIAGIFDGANSSTDTYFMVAQYDYVNAARAEGRDTVNGFIVRPAAGVVASELASRIDAAFANSSSPTRTQSEKQFLQAFIRQFADVGLIVRLVVGAAFATILMIVANSMLFAIRERTFEIGLLKTLGFRNGAIMGLILAESLLIFMVGGLIGLGLSKLATLLVGPQLGLVLSVPVLVKALGIMVAFGLLTGLLPALLAMNTNIHKTLRAR